MKTNRRICHLCLDYYICAESYEIGRDEPLLTGTCRTCGEYEYGDYGVCTEEAERERYQDAPAKTQSRERLGGAA